jgi:hypothetical protein
MSCKSGGGSNRPSIPGFTANEARQAVRDLMNNFKAQPPKSDCNIAKLNGNKTEATLPDGSVTPVVVTGKPNKYAQVCNYGGSSSIVHGQDHTQFSVGGKPPLNFYFVGVHKEGYVQLSGGGNNFLYKYYWPVISKPKTGELFSFPTVQFPVLIPDAPIRVINSEQSPSVTAAGYNNGPVRSFGFSENGEHFYFLSIIDQPSVGIIYDATGDTDAGLPDSTPFQVIWIVYENISFDGAQKQAIGSETYDLISYKNIRFGTFLIDETFFNAIGANPGFSAGPIHVRTAAATISNFGAVLSNEAILSMAMPTIVYNRSKEENILLYTRPTCPGGQCVQEPHASPYETFFQKSGVYSVYIPNLDAPLSNVNTRYFSLTTSSDVLVPAVPETIVCGHLGIFCTGQGYYSQITVSTTEHFIDQPYGGSANTELYDIGANFIRRVDFLTANGGGTFPPLYIYSLEITDYLNGVLSAQFFIGLELADPPGGFGRQPESLISRKVVFDVYESGLLPETSFHPFVSSDGIFSNHSNFNDFVLLINVQADPQNLNQLTCDVKKWKVQNPDLISSGNTAQIEQTDIESGFVLKFPKPVAMGPLATTTTRNRTHHFYLPLGSSQTDGVFFGFNYTKSQQTGQVFPPMLSSPSTFKVLSSPR